MNKLLSMLVIFGILIHVAPYNVHACQCGPPPGPLDQYAQVEAAFTGIVISITQDQTYPAFNNVEIHVTGIWKGIAASIVHVLTSPFDGSCGFTFLLAQEYLIYADDDLITESGPWTTTVCTRTRLVTDAQEDFDALGLPGPVPVKSVSWGAVKAMYDE